MQRINWYSVLALIGGGLLALMIHLNSQLAAQTSALNASWIAHGLGAAVAIALCSIKTNKKAKLSNEKPPKLFLLGGLPGAATVILAAITVNSSIGLSGTLALGLVGQISCSILCEHFGLFNLEKRVFSTIELVPVILVIMGSTLIIYQR